MNIDQIIKNGEEDKSGKTKKYYYLRSHYPEFAKSILRFSHENNLNILLWSQRVYYYVNKINNIPKCQETGKYNDLLERNHCKRDACVLKKDTISNFILGHKKEITRSEA